MSRIDDFTRYTQRRAVLLTVVVGVSLFVGCQSSGRQQVADTSVMPLPLLLGSDDKTPLPLPESAQAFRPILPETPVVPNGTTPPVETAIQEKINDLNGKVVALEKQLVEKDKKLAEKDEELKLALLPTDIPEAPKSLSTTPAILRKTLPVLPTIGIAGVVSEAEDDNIRIRIPDSALFQPGTIQLTPDGEDTIRSIASEIRTKYPNATLEIEGHTDSLQTDPTNVMQKHETASLKAQVVLKYFLESLQWTKTISSSGHGSSRPIADNASSEGRVQNNRIEIVVKGGGNRE